MASKTWKKIAKASAYTALGIAASLLTGNPITGVTIAAGAAAAAESSKDNG